MTCQALRPVPSRTAFAEWYTPEEYRDCAPKAIEEARRIDEVKDIRDKGLAMKVCADQAKDRRLLKSSRWQKLAALSSEAFNAREVPDVEALPGGGRQGKIHRRDWKRSAAI